MRSIGNDTRARSVLSDGSHTQHRTLEQYNFTSQRHSYSLLFAFISCAYILKNLILNKDGRNSVAISP
jgi:hypothetical protein